MGGSTISARFGVEGDEAIERALRKVERAGQDLAATLKRAGEQGSIDLDKVGEALARLDQQASQTTQRGRELGDALSDAGKKAGDGFSDAEKKGEQFGLTLGRGIAGAATAAVTAIAALGLDVYKTFGAMKDLSEQTGLTIAQIQALRQVVKGQGEDVEVLSRAMVTASRNVGLAAEGSEKLKTVLDRLGVGVLESNGQMRLFDTILREVLQSLAKLDDQATRNAIGAQFFGPAWIKLSDAFKNGGKDIDEASAALERNDALISEAAREKIEKLTKAVSSSSEAWKGLALNLVAEVSPALIQIVKDSEAAAGSFSKFLEIAAKWSVAGLLRSGAAPFLPSDQYGPSRPTGSSAPPGMRIADLEAELEASLRSHGGETVDSARIRAEIKKVRDEILTRSAQQASDAVSDYFNRSGAAGAYNPGKPELYGPDLPKGWKRTASGGGRGTADQTAKEYERAQQALDKYLDSLAREADLSDESARERAGHTAQLKAEELARASVLKMTEEQIQAIGEEARARATAAYDAKQAQEEQRRAAEQAQREMERLAEREAQLLQQPAEEAARSTQTLLRDFFKDAMSGNLTSWKDFWGKAKDIAHQYLAELATLLVIRPLIQPLFSVAGMGGLTGGAGAGSPISVGGVPYVPAGGGSGGLLGGGGGLGGGGLFGNAFGFLNQPIFGSAFDSAGAAATLGTGGIAAPAFTSGGLTWGGLLGGVGTIGMGALGLAQGNTIGGAAGILGGGLSLLSSAGLIGSAFGPIGMGIGLIGSILGSVLKKKPKTPQAVSNITFGTDGITNALAMTRSPRGGQLGQGTGQASGAFADAFAELLGAYDLSMAPGATGGWLLNSIGKNTGNQWIVGLGSYGSYTPLPGVDPAGKARDAMSSIQGIGSAEDAVNILAGLIARQGAIEGSIQGLTATQRTALSTADLKSIDDIKAALDFGQVFDDMERGADNITAVEKAMRELDKQYDAIAIQTKKYGLDLAVVEQRRQDAINKLATDTNTDYRRRILGMTPEGQLQVALEDLDKEHEQALKEALELNKRVTGALVDINQIEKYYADQRVAIVDAANAQMNAAMEQATAALEEMFKRLSYGDLSGASPLAAVTGSQATAEALYAQAQAGSLEARQQLPAAIQDLFLSQRAWSGNDASYEALRQLWLDRIAPFTTANGNTPPPANGNAVDGSLVAQMQRQVDTLTQDVTRLVATVQDQSREISRLLARM